MTDMDPLRLHIFGASGSGTTTLARAIATAWAVPHADTDDYFWEPTDPPYAAKRDPADRLRLMEELFVPRSAWVLSGSLVGWGEPLVPTFDAVVFVTVDPATRIERLRTREVQRYGSRIEPGGDLEVAHAEFIEWARGYDDPDFTGRSRVVHELWLADLPCPVTRVDGGRPLDELVATLLAWQPPA